MTDSRIKTYDEEDAIIFRNEESAKKFMEFCNQHENPDEQTEWLKRENQKDLVLKRNGFMGQKDSLSEALSTLGYDCYTATSMELKNIKRYAYGLMNDSSLRDEIFRAYYYFIWGISQGVSLSNYEEIQSVLDGSEEFADIDAIRRQVETTFDEFRQIKRIPESFTHIETAYDYLKWQLTFLRRHNTHKEELRGDDEIIQSAVAFVLRQQFLSGVCKPLIIAYLANPFAKEVKRIADLIIDQLEYPAQMVEVINVDEQSITIKLQKSIQHDEYEKAWKIIEGELRVKQSANGTDLLKSRLAFLHYMEKKSYGQIAKIYYPEYREKKANGKQNAEDLVRKTIKNASGIYINLDW